MKFKGTKGKWIITTNNEEGVLISTYPINRDICTIWKYDNNFFENQESSANAILISKAPEMLEMLKEVIECKSDVDYNRIEQLIKEATDL